MSIIYTSNLDLAKPVTGTEDGFWGEDVNNGITSYLDIAIAGTLALTSASFTANALTLANTQGNSLGTGITGTTAQYYVLKVSSLAANVTITAPSTSKSYIVVNLDPTYTVTLKAVGQTGVTVAVSKQALCVFNGTDYVQVGASAGGSTTQVQYNNAGSLAGSANLTFDGTTLATSALTSATPIGAASGGTGVGTTLSGVTITGTAGQFACTSASITFAAGQPVVISGTYGGTGSITGYTNPTTYYIIATNGSTTFTLSATFGGGAITTTAGTPTGLTYTVPPVNGALLIGNGTGFTRATLTAGTGITLTNTAGGITVAGSVQGPTLGLVRAVSINCILP